ncbi:unnamed protein product [marine sediment metagenome]|uniref:Alanine racemase N-terminal domain-containing protein n=1 Tax=marine sediment metagenome TaxID=412755 RepID=X0ZPW2_9ZZZZ
MQKLLGPTWTEVNLDAIAQNVRNIKKLIGEKKELMAVVKGNAYGHDILEVSSVVLKLFLLHLLLKTVFLFRQEGGS